MAPPIQSDLDSSQVLNRVFDEDNGRLRVDANATLSTSGQLEVVIDHTEDSIRLGDGTNFITSTSSGGKVALDVNVVGLSNLQSTPFIANLSMPVANTEYSYAIPANTTSLKFRSRESGKVKFAYNSGGTGSIFFTLSMGTTYEVNNINSVGNTLYFRSNKVGEVMEIEGWKT
jgi:hypothetical protein